MAFKVFDDKAHGTGFVVAVVTIPICILATALRFYISKLPGKKIGLEDWFALVALLAFLVYTGCNLWSKTIRFHTIGFYDSSMNSPSEATNTDISSLRHEWQERVQTTSTPYQNCHRYLQGIAHAFSVALNCTDIYHLGRIYHEYSNCLESDVRQAQSPRPLSSRVQHRRQFPLRCLRHREHPDCLVHCHGPHSLVLMHAYCRNI